MIKEFNDQALLQQPSTTKFAVDKTWLECFRNATDESTQVPPLDNTALCKASGKYIGELPIMKSKVVEGQHYDLVTSLQWAWLAQKFQGGPALGLE